jgi:hypothetical protein
MKFSVYTVLLLSTAASGFNIPNPFAGVMLAPTKGNVLLLNNNKGVLKQQILEAISSTNNPGKNDDLDTQKRVLQFLVRKLETKCPVLDTILTDPNEAKQLDGVWILQYTLPSDI